MTNAFTFNYNSQGAIQVIESQLLPVDETFPATSIETRREVNVLSGKKIDCIQQGTVLIVSPEMYQKLKQL